MDNNIVPSNMQYDQVLIDKSNNDESTLYKYQADNKKHEKILVWSSSCFPSRSAFLPLVPFLPLQKKNKDHDIVCAIAF